MNGQAKAGGRLQSERNVNLPVWILVFMFHGQPMSAGPNELEVCLYMAQQQQIANSNYRAHCYNVRDHRREYPDMTNKYLP